VQLENKFNALE